MSNLIVLTGIQGSGKGTFAKLLSENLDIVWVCVGDMFRWNIKNHTNLGKQISLINSGGMVPDHLTNNLVMKRLHEHDWDYNIILDGYPRNISQANYLLNEYEVGHVINLTIPDRVAVDRIRGRALLQGKNARKDDLDEDVINRRIELYHNETKPMLDVFIQYGVSVHNIENTGTIESTYSCIRSAIGL